MKILKFFFAFLILAQAVHAAKKQDEEQSWRFILLADWHSAEKYTQSEKDPDWMAEAIATDIASVRMLKENYGGELILMPGDSNSGHWDTKAFIDSNYPGATPEEAILKAGQLCYSGMVDVFRKGGYSRLIMAPGDHELGDNPWPAGSAVARCQPQFREAFAKELNFHPDGGRFRYTERIGDAVPRPLGTIFENTSYAYRHKNVLFITLDVFHQEDPEKVIGAEGSVTGTVTGSHLDWLEQVLSEARKDTGIKHILVQSHLPVIYPVRKVNSSGMMMDDGIENPFWKLMRKYKVDMYFAGEVHANTVTKDPQSDMIQLVSRGNSFSNFQTLDITDDRIEVVCYKQAAGTKVADGDYSVSGRLLIDKSGKSPRIAGEGELALLDTSDRIFHFDFERKVLLSDHPILGISFRGRKGDQRVLRGVPCQELLLNRGVFGNNYNALTANVELTDGVNGLAGKFGKDSRMGVFGMGPLHGNRTVSYALWIKTDSSKRQILINTGSIWGRQINEFFNLHLNDGVPEVMISNKQWISAEGTQLNDGKWHHIAVSMPSDGCLLSEVEVHVDGIKRETRVTGPDTPLFFNQAVRLGIGGLNFSRAAFDSLPVEPFVGEMDDVIIWTRSITPDDLNL